MVEPQFHYHIGLSFHVQITVSRGWRELMASKQTGQQRRKYIQMAMRIRTPTPGTEINPVVCFCMLHTLQNNSCVACILYQARPITG